MPAPDKTKDFDIDHSGGERMPCGQLDQGLPTGVRGQKRKPSQQAHPSALDKDRKRIRMTGAVEIMDCPQDKRFDEKPQDPVDTMPAWVEPSPPAFGHTTPKDSVHGSPPTTPTTRTSHSQGLLPATPMGFTLSYHEACSIDPSDSRARRIWSSLPASETNHSKQSSSIPPRFADLISRSSLNSKTLSSKNKMDLKSVEAALKAELRRAVFQYDGFWEDFLPDNPQAEERIRQVIKIPEETIEEQVLQKPTTTQVAEDVKVASDVQPTEPENKKVEENFQYEPLNKLRYNEEACWWTFDARPFQKANETYAYPALVAMLDPIGQAAFDKDCDPVFRPEYRPFVDHHNMGAFYDYVTDTATSPYIVKGVLTHDQGRCGVHWGDVELVVECKSKSDDSARNEAFLQLARYARAIFSHQIYRQFIHGIAVWGHRAAFLRFDRSGLLHSPEIDLATKIGQNTFIRKAVALVSLPAEAFGYDGRYTFESREGEHRASILFALDNQPRREVKRTLCHRKCCVGRATLVTSMAPVVPEGQKQPAEVGSARWAFYLDQEIVHKKIWRDVNRADEGTTLKKFEGVFGVCQVITSQDRVFTTAVRSPELLKPSPAAPRFGKTKASNQSNRSNARSTQAKDPGGVKSVALTATSTKQGRQTSKRKRAEPPVVERSIRVLSDIMMPEGKSILDARSSREIAMALHDVVLGLAAFTELGMVHCDVSVYNIYLISSSHYRSSHYQSANSWNAKLKGSLGNRVWGCGALALLPAGQPGEAITEDIEPRHKYVKNLNRPPRAALGDVEFSVNETREQEDVHLDRTGTPAFVSAQLLLDPPDRKKPVVRKYVHDLESVLWVLIWVVLHQDPRNMTPGAKKILRELSEHDFAKLGQNKKNILDNYGSIQTQMVNLGNSWVKELAPLIRDLARFFRFLLYVSEPLGEEAKDPSQITNWNEHRRLSSLSRWGVYKQILDIFVNKMPPLPEEPRSD